MPVEVKIKAELTVVLIFFMLLTAAGVFIGSVAVNDFAQARASISWQEAKGVVLSDPESGALSYVYIVNGRSYESRRHHFFTGRTSAAAATELEPGANIRVLYNPADPSFSVINPGGSGLIFFAALFAGGMLVFLGAGGLIRTLTIVRNEDDPFLFDVEKRRANRA